MDIFLEKSYYVNFDDPIIIKKASKLFNDNMTDIEKVTTTHEFVMDQIPHSFECNADVITAKASDVLKYKTGICHAKANLLAALLRSAGIPTGFCFQHITLKEDDSMGYCIHAFSAVYVNNTWIKFDAHVNRPQYDEYIWPGIYANPHAQTMQMLEKAKTLQDVLDNIPDFLTECPDVI